MSRRTAIAVFVAAAMGSAGLHAARLSDHQRQGMFDILFEESPAAALPLVDVPIGRDTTPPRVIGLQIVTFPDDPSRRRVSEAGNVFVGLGTLELRLTASEPMAAAPKLVLRQPGGFVQEAALTDASANPLFVYRVFPVPSPEANGPAALIASGEFDGRAPDFGYDRANNPLAAFTVERAVIIDTLPPGLRRVDISVPGNFRSIPAENQVLPATGFPREIMAFVADYNRPDDGTFAGPNLATDLASGVDFERAGELVDIRVFDPRGRRLPGTVVTRPPAVVLLLPDPYDPRAGVFTDTDGDGRADPIEGTYRIETDLVDRAGNRTTASLSLSLDSTPLGRTALQVSIQPVFSEPFPNPGNPIPETGAAVRRLERVEVASSDPDFDLARSTARLLSRLGGPNSVAREMRVTLERRDGKLILSVSRDQDGDGRDDFENPPPGEFLPPGVPDPRLGRNDGTYIVEVKAFDRAGNVSMVTRELVLDTTPPRGEASFPAAMAKVRGPLRIVDAFLDDPVAASGNPGAGIRLDAASIRLDFQGNPVRPAGPVRGIAFVHTPNPDDPTRPDFNPADRRHKVLLEILDPAGHPVSLPTDGTADGVYVIDVRAVDRAGNSASFITSFEYTQTATSTLTQPLPLRNSP